MSTTVYSHGLTNKECEQAPRITVRADNPTDYVTVKFEVAGLDVARFVQKRDDESLEDLVSRVVLSLSEITIVRPESVGN